MTHHLYPFSDERSYFFGPLHDHNRLCHGSKTFFRKPDKDKRFFTVFVVKNTSFAAISCRKLSGGGVLTVWYTTHKQINVRVSSINVYTKNLVESWINVFSKNCVSWVSMSKLNHSPSTTVVWCISVATPPHPRAGGIGGPLQTCRGSQWHKEVLFTLLHAPTTHMYVIYDQSSYIDTRCCLAPAAVPHRSPARLCWCPWLCAWRMLARPPPPARHAQIVIKIINIMTQ